MKIPESVIRFFEKQSFVFVGTADATGVPNLVPKGLSEIDPKGIIYIVDLFPGCTKKNIDENGNATVARVDERLYAGFQLKGTARWLSIDEAGDHAVHLAAWRKKVAQRITNRVIDNLQKEYKTHHHEAHFPEPRGIIELTVTDIINLSEPTTRQGE